MGWGILELFLVALIGFGQAGVKETKSGATANQVMVYAPPQTDVFAYLDWQALIPGLWDTIFSFEKQPHAKELADDLDITKSRDLLKRQLDMFSEQVGLNPIRDIDWFAMWLSFGATSQDQDVQMLFALRAKLPADFLERVARISGQKLSTDDGVSVLAIRGEAFVAGIASDGTLLLGAKRLVEPRLSPRWKKLRRLRGALPIQVASALKSKSAVILSSEPGRNFRRLIKPPAHFDTIDRSLVAVMSAHEIMTAAVRHDALDLTWKARSTDGFVSAKLGIEGMVDLLRASHSAVRGMVKVGVAAIRTFAARNETLKRLTKYEKFILTYTERWVGDGNFKAKIKASKRNRLVKLSLTDTSVARILPIAALGPMVAVLIAKMPRSETRPESQTPEEKAPEPEPMPVQ